MFRRLYQKRPTLVILGGLALITSPCWGGIGFVVAKVLYVRNYVWTDEDRAFRGDDGLPSDARKWKGIIENVPDPESAMNHPDLSTQWGFALKRFENGEWIFGISTDSHQLISRGGTVVLKDSSGKTRVFYGHVCTREGLQYLIDNHESVGEFYTSLSQSGYQEQFLDQ
jgi:hypothetical protein